MFCTVYCFTYATGGATIVMFVCILGGKKRERERDAYPEIAGLEIAGAPLCHHRARDHPGRIGLVQAPNLSHPLRLQLLQAAVGLDLTDPDTYHPLHTLPSSSALAMALPSAVMWKMGAGLSGSSKPCYYTEEAVIEQISP